jgi:hypothetical protein
MTESFMLQIEICPFEPRANLYDEPEGDSPLPNDLLDCTTGGQDAEPACQYVIDTWSPVFVIADPTLNYERRKALPSEIQATAEHIYCDHEKGEFADMGKATLYLVWEAANQFQQQREEDSQ